MDLSISALHLVAVILAKPQQLGPSWMTVAVSVVCLFAVLTALRGERGPSSDRLDSRSSSRVRQRHNGNV